MTVRQVRYRHPLVERIEYHIARAVAWARRATLPGIAVRATVWLAGIVAVVLAAPPAMAPLALAPAAAVLALPAAAKPGSGWVSLVELLAIGAAAAVALDDSYSFPLWRILLLAAVLYTHHTAAALGAQLRTDAVIPAAVLRRWAVRAGLVLGVSLPVGLAVAVFADQAPDGGVAGAATAYIAVGTAAAVGLTLLLVRRSRE
jgi:hypothetical protein